MVCERVEAFGKLHDEPAEIVELLLEVDSHGGCVIGGFGFIAQAAGGQLDRQAAASCLYEDAERCSGHGEQCKRPLGVQQHGGAERDPGKLMRRAFGQADRDGGDHDGHGSG